MKSIKELLNDYWKEILQGHDEDLYVKNDHYTDKMIAKRMIYMLYGQDATSNWFVFCGEILETNKKWFE